jgi:hypothetical protein
MTAEREGVCARVWRWGGVFISCRRKRKKREMGSQVREARSSFPSHRGTQKEREKRKKKSYGRDARLRRGRPARGRPGGRRPGRPPLLPLAQTDRAARVVPAHPGGRAPRRRRRQVCAGAFFCVFFFGVGGHLPSSVFPCDRPPPFDLTRTRSGGCGACVQCVRPQARCWRMAASEGAQGGKSTSAGGERRRRRRARLAVAEPKPKKALPLFCADAGTPASASPRLLARVAGMASRGSARAVRAASPERARGVGASQIGCGRGSPPALSPPTTTLPALSPSPPLLLLLSSLLFRPQGPMKLMAEGYAKHGEVFTVPVLHK